MFYIDKPELFYRDCLVDFWQYKTMVLANSILNYQKIKPELTLDMENVNDNDCSTALKVEIHFTYFQAVEALFSMVFALLRRKIDNRNLLVYLATLGKPEVSRTIYKKIEEIARGDTTALDQSIIAGPNLKVPFVQYVFYFGSQYSLDAQAMRKNLATVKKIMIQFARDFTDRDEYNAYKHSFRLFPTQNQTLEIVNRKTQKAASFSTGDAITYLKLEPDNRLSQVSKPMDWERDVRMTRLCQALIYNIIQSRRTFYFKDDKRPINSFIDIDVDAANRIEGRLGKTSFTVSPVEEI